MSEPINFGNEAIRYLYWNDLQLGIEYEVGQLRFGRPMQVMYGYIVRHLGADGDALDCYIGPYLSSNRVFRVRQVKPDGTFDEYKYMLCFDTPQTAERTFKQHIPADRYGGIEEVSLATLQEHYRPNAPKFDPVQLDDNSDYAERLTNQQ